MLLNDEKIGKNQFKGTSIKDAVFSNCDFSGADLTDTEFLNCRFYDRDTQKACRFNRSILKDASFKNCDLSMVDFRHSQALGLEIRECLAQGADFRGVSFRGFAPISPKLPTNHNYLIEFKIKKHSFRQNKTNTFFYLHLRD